MGNDFIKNNTLVILYIENIYNLTLRIFNILLSTFFLIFTQLINLHDSSN